MATLQKSQIVWTDSFATSRNLASLWPHDSYTDIPRRVVEGSLASHTVYGRGKTVSLLSAIEGQGSTTLAVFPKSMKNGLNVLVRKATCFLDLYLVLQNLDIDEDEEPIKCWAAVLLNEWGRDCIYMDRVLEGTVQWARAPNQPSTCNILRLFLLQEEASTLHDTTVASEYDFSQSGDGIFRRSECSPLFRLQHYLSTM